MNKSSIVKYSSMAIGGAGALVAAYNIYKDGKMHAHENTEEELGEHYVDIFEKNGIAGKDSNLHTKIRNYVTMRRINSPLYEFLVKLKNYPLQFAKETIQNIDTIILSAVAIGASKLLYKKPIYLIDPEPMKIIPIRNKIGIGLSAAAAGLLVLDAARVFIHDIWGVGKDHAE
jgi:uncharacterized membrane protein